MPTIITTPTFTTDFKINTTPSKIIFTDTTNYTTPSIPTTGVRGVFSVTAPSGTVIYNNTSYGAGSDIIRNISANNSANTTISLPTNSNGSVVRGSYIITYTVQINDGVNPVYYINTTNTYNNQYVTPTVSILQTVDCISPLFTSDDTTNYSVNGVFPTITRTHTLDYPYGSAGEGSPLISSSATLTTSTFYNGTQATEISSVLTYTFTDGLIVSDTIEGSREFLVNCEFICSIYCCIRSVYNNRENFRGVNQVEFNKYSSLFDEVMSTVGLVLLSIDCGKTSDTESLLDKIKTIANCTDDCSCNDGTPSLVTGISGGSGVTVDVVSGGSPVIITSSLVGSTKTYTITLDSSFINKVNNSYNTVVAAGANVTVTPVTVGDTTTYTIDVNGAGSFTNATPTSTALGGYPIGSTFSSVDFATFANTLMYPYQLPVFLSFAISGQSTTVEAGTSISSGSQTFTWTTSNSTNITTNSIAIKDVTGAVTLGSGLANDGTEIINFASPITIAGQGSYVWSIEATNTNTTLFSTIFTVNWRFKLFYGNNALAVLAESDIESLSNSSLTTTALGTYAFSGASGQYKYLSFPTTFTQPTTFKDQATNLSVPFTRLSDVTVVNGLGVSQSYAVWRSFNMLGGAITIIVS